MITYKELKARWNAESPEIFQDIQKFGNYLIGLGTGIIAIPATLDQLAGVNMNLSLLGNIAGYVIFAGTIITTIAKLPVSSSVRNPDIIKK